MRLPHHKAGNFRKPLEMADAKPTRELLKTGMSCVRPTHFICISLETEHRIGGSEIGRGWDAGRGTRREISIRVYKRQSFPRGWRAYLIGKANQISAMLANLGSEFVRGARRSSRAANRRTIVVIDCVPLLLEFATSPRSSTSLLLGRTSQQLEVKTNISKSCVFCGFF